MNGMKMSLVTVDAAEYSRVLYLDLLKRSLTNWIHGHEEFVQVRPNGFAKHLSKFAFPKGSMLVSPQRFNEEQRAKGTDWPPPLFAHTMVGLRRLDNLQICIENVIADQIPGDLIETGVWKGGSTIFMRGVLRVHGDNSRRVWVADSFEGLPVPDVANYPDDAGDIHYQIDSLRVTLEEVKMNFKAYDLLDDNVIFLKGWFSDTLPNAPIEKLSILRLDGDMYGSTMDALTNLYSKVSAGGYVIIDDYCIDSCRKAVTDFRRGHNVTDSISDIDGSGVFWRKSA